MPSQRQRAGCEEHRVSILPHAGQMNLAPGCGHSAGAVEQKVGSTGLHLVPVTAEGLWLHAGLGEGD